MRLGIREKLYFPGRTDIDGAKILICDKNGTVSPDAGVNNWASNHSGEGGYVITVAGRGFWVPADLTTGRAIQPGGESLDLESMFSGTAIGY